MNQLAKVFIEDVDVGEELSVLSLLGSGVFLEPDMRRRGSVVEGEGGGGGEAPFGGLCF